MDQKNSSRSLSFLLLLVLFPIYGESSFLLLLSLSFSNSPPSLLNFSWLRRTKVEREREREREEEIYAESRERSDGSNIFQQKYLSLHFSSLSLSLSVWYLLGKNLRK
jgi:hypothetical protein